MVVGQGQPNAKELGAALTQSDVQLRFDTAAMQDIVRLERGSVMQCGCSGSGIGNGAGDQASGVIVQVTPEDFLLHRPAATGAVGRACNW